MYNNYYCYSSGSSEHQALMDVIDSTKHLVARKVKDAGYLAKQILPVMMEVDLHKDCFDLVACDGATNVQKAGRIIEE